MVIQDGDRPTIREILDIEQGLRASEEKLRGLYELSPLGIALTSMQGAYIEFNQAFQRICGYSREELNKLDYWALTPREYAAREADQLEMLSRTGRYGPYEKECIRKDGTRVPLRLNGVLVTGSDGRPCIWSIVEDITQSRQAEEKLRIYANAFENSGEAILISDRENRIISTNRAFTALTGYELDDIRGQDPSLLASGHTAAETYRGMWAALADAGYWQGELWDRRKDGQVYPKWISISAIRDAGGKLTHYIASFTDISERKAAEERIHHLAHHDALTGLLNRFSLEDRLEQALLTARREGAQLAVMFIDMDRFKVVNDTLGHHVGDKLLVEVALRLRAAMRESDIVARLGGDEFIVVLTGVESETVIAAVAEKILQSLGRPYLVEEHELHSTPSMGISVFPQDGGDGAALMKCADAAMYHAKEHGRNNFQFFTATMTVEAEERLRLERDMRVALATGQFQLHYQPQLCVATGRTCCIEALARWSHPEAGMIPPLKFIPIAEETGMIEALGNWVLEEACRQLAAWHAMGLGGLRVAINISAKQLRSEALVEAVRGAMERHGIGGGQLEIEITESVAMDNPERAIDQLIQLRGLGIELSIDDFGTGYSSLAYLKRLPIQSLKLDRSFVRDIETDENDAAISAATLALAHKLGLKVIAEGVETDAQRDFLLRHDCDLLQGYLFSKPLPGPMATDYLKQANCMPLVPA